MWESEVNELDETRIDDDDDDDDDDDEAPKSSKKNCYISLSRRSDLTAASDPGTFRCIFVVKLQSAQKSRG